jgi:hypothetical protein
MAVGLCFGPGELTVRIRMQYPASMRIEGVKSGSVVEVDEGVSIGKLLRSCSVKQEHLKYILAYVNGEKRGMTHRLCPDDVLKLYLPIGGG